MGKKGFWFALSANIIWGILPAYWHLMDYLEPMTILAARVIWGAGFSMLLLAVTGRMGAVKRLLTDKRMLRWLLLNSVLITANWGLYIWAVNSGRVLDASLGYYIDPLMNLALAILLFRERFGGVEIVSIALAVTGVVISTISTGVFPLSAILMAAFFALYSAVLKHTHIDAMAGIACVTTLMTPVAVLYMLLSPGGQGTLSAMNLKTGLLLLGAGPATAIPLMMYARGINELPMTTVAFLQFVLPTLLMIMGVAVYGEVFTMDKAVTFAFIVAALIVYTAGIVLREKRRQRLAEIR